MSEKVNLGKTIPQEGPHNTQNYACCPLFRQIFQSVVKTDPICNQYFDQTIFLLVIMLHTTTFRPIARKNNNCVRC